MFNILKRLLTIPAIALAVFTTGSAAYAQTAGDLQAIVDRKVVRVGAIEAPPWYQQDLLTGKWVGIVPEVVEAVFSYIDVEVEYIPTEWGSAVAGLQSGKFDLVGGYTATPARGLVVDFSNPVGIVPTGIVTLKSELSSVTNWADLDKPDIRIAAVDGAATTRGVQSLMPNATWALVKTNDAMLLELESGRADVIISNQPTLMQYLDAKKQGKLILPLPDRGTTAPFGMRKTTTRDLQQWLNLSMEYAKADGIIQAIWNKYLPLAE